MIDPLWSNLASQVDCQNVNQHVALNAGIWAMNVYVSETTLEKSQNAKDENFIKSTATVIATVSSDGTVRTADVALSVLGRHRTKLGFVKNLFRMHRVMKTNSDLVESEAELHAKHEWVFYYSTTQYDCLRDAKPEVRISLPPAAMHCIDSYPLDNSKRTSLSARMFAYGGSLGIIRLHETNLPI
jgi:hypothetical protein